MAAGGVEYLHSDFSQTRLSSETASIDDRVAPAPAVPLYGDEGMARPSTAPVGRPLSTTPAVGGSRSKREVRRRPPPLSFRRPQLRTVMPGSRPGSRGSEKTVTSLFGRPSGRLRASSCQSDAGGGFKDLLDAQDEINPADFRTRVKAAGAKEYGEDVAARNMGQNGFDLESAHVRAFYAQPPRQPEADENRPSAAIRPKTSMSDAGLTKKPHHYLGHRFPAIALSPKLGPANKEPAGSRACQDGTPVLSLRLSTVSLGAVLRVPTPDMRTEMPGRPAREFSPPRKTPNGPPHRRARRPRDSVKLAKERAELAEMPVLEDSEEDDISPRAFSRSATQPLRISSIRSASSFPRTQHSLHALQSSVSLSTASHDTVAPAPPSFNPRSSSRQHHLQAEDHAVSYTSPTSVDHAAFTHPPGSAPAPC